MRDKLIKKELVLGLIILFVGASVIPSIGGAIIEKQPNYLKFAGNTLYVGGSGPNNYTKIQDAIDNASDGDTIFVYNGTYYEHVFINISLTLEGENKYTTIIDATNQSICTGISIHEGAEIINISNFTIQNAVEGIFAAGGTEINIYFNIINKCESGIYFAVSNCHITIVVNEITECKNGLYLVGALPAYDINVNDNVIIDNEVGIYVLGVEIAEIASNNISSNNIGIHFVETDGVTVTGNIFTMNAAQGIFLEGRSTVAIIENNFIKNKKHVFFVNCFLSFYQNNFWDNWIGLKYSWATWFPKVLIGRFGPIPWPNFDWYPALEPYDI